MPHHLNRARHKAMVNRHWPLYDRAPFVFIDKV